MTQESQTQQTTKKFPGVKWFVELLLFSSSPFALMLLLLMLVAVATETINHQRFVNELETQGRTTYGEVESIWEDWEADEGRINFVWQDIDGRSRWGHLEKQGHPPETWASLAPGDVVEIRYLPQSARYDEQVVLEAAYPEVRAYQPQHSTKFILIGVSLAWLALKPQILYLGYVDSDRLLREGIPTP